MKKAGSAPTKPHIERHFTATAAVRDLAIGLSYITAGLIPLAPYFLLCSLSTALWVSVGPALIAWIRRRPIVKHRRSAHATMIGNRVRPIGLGASIASQGNLVSA